MTYLLRHADILQPGAMIHLTRATLTTARPKALHKHDYFEVFWVQNGIVRHHTPAGSDRLGEGDLILVSPEQEHAIQGKGEHAMIVSISVHPDVVNALNNRHAGVWPTGPVPARLHRDMRQLSALNHAALVLEASPCNALAAEAFLLPLLADLQAGSTPQNAPDWLARALTAAQKAPVFQEGAAGFVAQTGRAHAHVSRTMRKVTGQSPSEYINMIRMAHAARALTTDSEPVSQIAATCGIPNMAHFHKLFRAHHGMTPLQYRQQYQRNVVQPA
ncbi:transcriptional regulator, AraC family [Cognatiyoonia koreensis]|uniref:Transcriptional regulator, AraC family n=1 Tax=Cognatiyoonia koreensis TaxID=364200 RepID=A0A1I0QQI5_9RHOB|nr:AraC family transcriptional regulator [Cognatiyoonia koreensis]SEW29585.1 transcriptional regulator, AraC family [Cognatiyoonia koreensis]